MRDVAREAYDSVAVGATGWIRPDPTKGETLQGFQAVAQAADYMQEKGLILIRSIHRESTSGRNLIDAVQFMKMR